MARCAPATRTLPPLTPAAAAAVALEVSRTCMDGSWMGWAAWWWAAWWWAAWWVSRPCHAFGTRHSASRLHPSTPPPNISPPPPRALLSSRGTLLPKCKPPFMAGPTTPEARPWPTVGKRAGLRNPISTRTAPQPPTYPLPRNDTPAADWPKPKARANNNATTTQQQRNGQDAGNLLEKRPDSGRRARGRPVRGCARHATSLRNEGFSAW